MQTAVVLAHGSGLHDVVPALAMGAAAVVAVVVTLLTGRRGSRESDTETGDDERVRDEHHSTKDPRHGVE